MAGSVTWVDGDKTVADVRGAAFVWRAGAGVAGDRCALWSAATGGLSPGGRYGRARDDGGGSCCRARLCARGAVCGVDARPGEGDDARRSFTAAYRA